MFDEIGEDRDDLDEDEEVGQAKLNDKESLVYSAGTGTMNATSLNFGISASRSLYNSILRQKQDETLKE